jgi:hypothetical protein
MGASWIGTANTKGDVHTPSGNNTASQEKANSNKNINTYKYTVHKNYIQ